LSIQLILGVVSFIQNYTRLFLIRQVGGMKHVRDTAMVSKEASHTNGDFVNCLEQKPSAVWT
jgi:hypothetical protein